MKITLSGQTYDFGPPILDPKKVPEGWVENVFGIVHPALERMQLWVQPISGFEIRKDGVYLTENGVRRKAEWPEDVQLRSDVMQLFGVEIARAAGIEPE